MGYIKTLTLQAYFYLAALNGVSAFIYLLNIPNDPKNVWFFGMSGSRLVLLGVPCPVLGLLCGGVTIPIKKKAGS